MSSIEERRQVYDTCFKVKSYIGVAQRSVQEEMRTFLEKRNEMMNHGSNTNAFIQIDELIGELNEKINLLHSVKVIVNFAGGYSKYTNATSKIETINEIIGVEKIRDHVEAVIAIYRSSKRENGFD